MYHEKHHCNETATQLHQSHLAKFRPNHQIFRLHYPPTNSTTLFNSPRNTSTYNIILSASLKSRPPAQGPPLRGGIEAHRHDHAYRPSQPICPEGDVCAHEWPRTNNALLHQILAGVTHIIITLALSTAATKKFLYIMAVVFPFAQQDLSSVWFSRYSWSAGPNRR